MHIDPYIVLGSAIIGFLVGMTGAGGGALMTPMLILLFGVKPSAAISSDLVAAVVMRPFGAAVHLRKGTVNRSLVGWMVLGSVPMAFLGAYLLHLMGNAKSAQTNIETRARRGAAGRRRRRWCCATCSTAAAARSAPASSTTSRRTRCARSLIGMIGGVVVGMTSVGSGSLMIILLLFLYPMIGANQLVGTDLTQAVPLTLAAALGALAFGHVEFGVTASLIIGSVPAVLVGSLFSSSAPDRYVRPVITFVIAASGLKYVGVGTTALGWILCATLLVGALSWLAYSRPWQRAEQARGPRVHTRRAADRAGRRRLIERAPAAGRSQAAAEWAEAHSTISPVPAIALPSSSSSTGTSSWPVSSRISPRLPLRLKGTFLKLPTTFTS